MYEYEFRRVRHLSSFQEAKDIIESIGIPSNYYVTIFANSYRYKHQKLEYKKKERCFTVYCGGFWFKFVESLEIPFSKFNKHHYKTVYELFGLSRNIVMKCA